jgi:hypothetical protein
MEFHRRMQICGVMISLFVFVKEVKEKSGVKND